MTFVRRMLLASTFTLAAVTGATFSPVTSEAANVSPAVGNALKEARRATSAAGVEGAIIRASAAATGAEKSVVNQAAVYEYNRVGARGKAADYSVSAGLPAITTAQLYYGAGNFGKAIEYGNKVGGKTGTLLIAQSYVRLGNASKAADAYKRLISIAGPQKDYLSNLAAQQAKSGDKAGFQTTLAQLIRIDPSPKNWAGVLAGMKGTKMPDSARLALFMLIDETGNLSGVEDVAEMSKLAMVQSAPGLAKSVLEKASAGALAADPTVKGLSGMLPQQIAKANTDLAGLSKLTDSTSLMKTARIYMGAGNYPKALAAFAAAGKAPGVNAGEVGLYTAISQLKSGNLAGAKATLGTVKAADSFGDLASLWKLYASTKG
jgi:tetratricopeptide (TPR) repeat protein